MPDGSPGAGQEAPIQVIRAVDAAGKPLPPGARTVDTSGRIIEVVKTSSSFDQLQKLGQPPSPEPTTEAEYLVACQKLLDQLGVTNFSAKDLPSNGKDATNMQIVGSLLERALQVDPRNPVFLKTGYLYSLQRTIGSGIAQRSRSEQLLKSYAMLKNIAALRQNPGLATQLAQELRRIETIAQIDPHYPGFSIGMVIGDHHTKPFDVIHRTHLGVPRPELRMTVDISAPIEGILAATRQFTQLPPPVAFQPGTRG